MHTEGCRCYVCYLQSEEGLTFEQAMEKYWEWEKGQLEKHGWFIHYLMDERYPTGANHHTHGLAENLDHPDLQIVVQLPSKAVQAIFDEIVNRIKDGQKFKHGDISENVINNYSVKFLNAEETGRSVLRVIIPDKNNNLERDMEPGLAKQYDDL